MNYPGLLLLLGIGLLACSPAENDHQSALAFTQGWFDQARAGVRDEALCHGLGLLKHPPFSCADLLDHAAQVKQRNLTAVTPMDCMESVCGEFYELRFDGSDTAGNEASEIVVLKKDNGQLRMYWYRSTSLLKLLASPEDDPLEKSPEQRAYVNLTNRYPELYAWPPCYGVRVSSSNLMAPLTPVDGIDVSKTSTLAAQCGPTFCFAFVGNKVASLCPIK